MHSPVLSLLPSVAPICLGQSLSPSATCRALHGLPVPSPPLYPSHQPHRFFTAPAPCSALWCPRAFAWLLPYPLRSPCGNCNSSPSGTCNIHCKSLPSFVSSSASDSWVQDARQVRAGYLGLSCTLRFGPEVGLEENTGWHWMGVGNSWARTSIYVEYSSAPSLNHLRQPNSAPPSGIHFLPPAMPSRGMEEMKKPPVRLHMAEVLRAFNLPGTPRQVV